MTEMEWAKDFGNNLKSLLNEKGFTQKELSDDTCLGESTISYYIQGKRIPSIRALIKIGYALDCDPEDLIDFYDDME